MLTPNQDRLHVLFATAELRPLVSAGGLGEAASGLVAALRAADVDVTVVLPDYFRWELASSVEHVLDVSEWAAPATVRIGQHADAGRVALVSVPGIERPDPYVDENGEGWADNTERFAAFAAAIGALVLIEHFDVVHLNDWHTALAPAFIPSSIPTMLTIHNLGHQGAADHSWLHRLPTRRESYVWGDGVNALAGAIQSATRVSTVSPHYAEEIVTEADGMGLHYRFEERAADLIGIRNGIDVRTWDPALDPYTPNFSFATIEDKQQARSVLLARAGWEESTDPVIVMVTRLVEQKGVDLAFEAARFLEGMKARLMILGSGDRRLADWARWLQADQPDRFWFFDGYDVPLSHEMFAGGDLLLMPSRFEPCGLAQMQAMAYGTIPIVSAVGGLVDTVVDADSSPDGNGIVTTTIDESGVVDGLHRGLRSVRHTGRKRALQRRGMTTDWSWTDPAQRYIQVYREMVDREV
jgi:starch synthase